MSPNVTAPLSCPSGLRRRAGRLALALLCLVAAAVASVLTGVSAPSAASPAPLRAGAGWQLGGGDFVGYYLLPDGTKVYCIDPERRAPGTVTLTAAGALRGASAHTVAQLAYVLHTWGNARSRNGAAVTSQLVNTVAGNRAAVARRAAQLPAAVERTVHERLRIVRAQAGPYTVTVSAGSGGRVPLPGQTATAQVRVRSAGGHGVPGVTVRVAATDAAPVPTRLRTDAHGTATFRYTATDTGPIRLRATAADLAPAVVLASHAGTAVQRMVSWSAPVSATTLAVLAEHPGGISSETRCTTACDGHPQVVLRACAAAGTEPARLTYAAGSQVRTIDVPAGSTERCTSVPMTLADGDRVTAQWQFQGPRGWTRPLAAPGGFVVDCPPVPAVTVTLHYDCTQAGLTASVAAGTHPVAILVTGTGGQRVQAAAGQPATFTIATSCTDPRTFAVRAGVQRANGAWNYGPQASVTTPGPSPAP